MFFFFAMFGSLCGEPSGEVGGAGAEGPVLDVEMEVAGKLCKRTPERIGSFGDVGRRNAPASN